MVHDTVRELVGRQEAAPVTPPSAADDSELSHLRDYQRGDPPRRIAWKAMARSQRLLTKQFATPAASNVWLDWDALPHSDDETRLSWLCGAVLELERINRRYGLRLPSTLLAPASGAAHRDACLRALALFGLPVSGAGA